MQVFIARNGQEEDLFDRRLLIVRKRVQNIINKEKKPYTESFYVCSLSSRTIIYKGQILGYRLEEFFLDLQNERITTSMVLVHERYSTNTFPSWKLAQPFRYIAHNGEINTIRGNINWMNAREGVMYSQIFSDELNKVLPIIEPGGSDSASLDNAVELFYANKHSLVNTMMILIPEAWQKDSTMEKEKRGFYEYFARVMEPWDGPATIAFADGIRIGVTVDRNGLRPARYVITKDQTVIMASEAGVVDIAPEYILEKGCIQPGKILLVDTNEGRIIPDEEMKKQAYLRKPFGDWVDRNRLEINDLELPYEVKKMNIETLYRNQIVFGYTKEELEKILAHMAENGKEPIGSMGFDTPLAVLSERPQLLFNYFKQKFAQVTNPPIDPIREESIMSLVQFIGNHGKLLDEIETEKDRKYIKLEHPILTNGQLESIRGLRNNDFNAIAIPMVFQADRGNDGLKEALDYLCKRAEENVKNGYNILILSDRNLDMYSAPIPSLLALSAVHQHLIRKKLRTTVDLVLEAGDARDVMHMAALIGFGAKAINPYMALETISYLVENSLYIRKGISEKAAIENYIKTLYEGFVENNLKNGYFNTSKL